MAVDQGFFQDATITARVRNSHRPLFSLLSHAHKCLSNNIMQVHKVNDSGPEMALPNRTDDHGPKIEAENESPTETAPVRAAPYSVFGIGARRTIVALCALAGFLSPFSAFTYFPALEYMAEDLGVSLQLMDLTITMFLVVQGIIPAVLGDIADQVGRRPVYILVLIVYCVACVLLTVQRSYPVLMAGRMLQSAGSSGKPSPLIYDVSVSAADMCDIILRLYLLGH